MTRPCLSPTTRPASPRTFRGGLTVGWDFLSGAIKSQTRAVPWGLVDNRLTNRRRTGSARAGKTSARGAADSSLSSVERNEGQVQSAQVQISPEQHEATSALGNSAFSVTKPPSIDDHRYDSTLIDSDRSMCGRRSGWSDGDGPPVAATGSDDDRRAPG